MVFSCWFDRSVAQPGPCRLPLMMWHHHCHKIMVDIARGLRRHTGHHFIHGGVILRKKGCLEKGLTWRRNGCASGVLPRASVTQVGEARSPMASRIAAISCSCSTIISWGCAKVLVMAIEQFGLGHVDRALVVRNHHRDEIIVDVARGLIAMPAIILFMAASFASRNALSEGCASADGADHAIPTTAMEAAKNRPRRLCRKRAGVLQFRTRNNRASCGKTRAQGNYSRSAKINRRQGDHCFVQAGQPCTRLTLIRRLQEKNRGERNNRLDALSTN